MLDLLVKIFGSVWLIVLQTQLLTTFRSGGTNREIKVVSRCRLRLQCNQSEMWVCMYKTGPEPAGLSWYLIQIIYIICTGLAHILIKTINLYP